MSNRDPYSDRQLANMAAEINGSQRSPGKD